MTIIEPTKRGEGASGAARTLGRVLHPCDLSKGDENAFLHALRIAVAAKADFDLVHVQTDGEALGWAKFPSVIEPLRRWGISAHGKDEEAFETLGMALSKEQYTGENAFAAIESFMVARGPDIMVVSTHQRKGWDRFLHGSIAEPLARSASATTLFLPRGVEGFVNPRTGGVRLKNVLVPVGSQATAEAAFQLAKLLPKLFGEVDTHFTFLYVGDENALPDPGETLQWAWTTERRAWRGDVVDHIRDSALETKADLIVMMTGGHHNALDAVRGSITERVVREAKCAVLAAPYELQARDS